MVLALVCAGLAAAPAWAQEAAVTRRAIEVRASPGEQGRSVASLPAQAPVIRTNERQGPWVQVRTGSGATGWVHLFDIGPASASAAGGGVASSALRGVTSLFGGARPATQTGTTAGIRGLDRTDLAQAQPDPRAVSQAEGFRASEGEARSYAERSAWRPAPVDPLPQSTGTGIAPAPAPGEGPQSP